MLSVMFVLSFELSGSRLLLDAVQKRVLSTEGGREGGRNVPHFL